MDFFAAASDPATDPVSVSVSVSLAPSDDKSDVSDFAQAIADRFGHSASLVAHHHRQQQPSSILSPPVSSSSAFPPVAPSDLDQWLHASSVLIVDIRPHAAHNNARIPHAISLCVPSTLLKRPLFSLQKLCSMLPSPRARTRFSAWRSSSRILVYDADSHNIADSSNINGLLRKFKADGFQGELAWLKGGFQAVWRDRRDLVDSNPPEPEIDDDDNDNDDHDKSASHSNLLRTRHLPMAAFSLSSTAIHGSPFISANKQRQQQQQPQQQPSHTVRSPSQSTSSSSFHASNPFFDAIRQNVELTHGVTERIPLQLPRRVRKRIKDLPLPWLQEIAKKAANTPARSISLSDTSTTSDSESGDDFYTASAADIEEGQEALASQFYQIELAERNRLMGIMEYHSRDSGHSVRSTTEQKKKSSVAFPFSITAGVEKGAKNRYRHIWPFEHARVRLHHSKDGDDDDYVNASYVQPLGTSRRYIATQGPLPATFTDFWTLCWEQNVHVIVMLTREVEGAMVKCDSYWTDTDFGPLQLKLVSTEGLDPPPDGRPHASSSPQAPLNKPHWRNHHHHHHYRTKRSEIVKRTFELTHTRYPDAKLRRIVHLQYLEWPDMNVPDDPRSVLGLIKQVDEAVRETREVVEDQGLMGEKRKMKRRRNAPRSLSDVDEKTGIAKHALGKNSPVLLHCSAGVGRTGGFIAVDAVLDGIRSQIRAKYKEKKEALEKEEQERQHAQGRMDVDATLSRTVAVKISSGRVGQSSCDQSAGNENDGDKPPLVVHVPLAMEIDESRTERDDTTPPEGGSSPSPPPPADRHKYNKAGTKQWAENVRYETGVEGQWASKSQASSKSPSHSPSQPPASSSSSPQPYASTSSRSSPEIVVVTQPNSNGNSSGSSVNGDQTSRSSGTGGVYLMSTPLGTSVSGASTSSLTGGGPREKVNAPGSESEAGKEDGNSSSRSSSSQPQQEQNTTSSHSSCAMSSEGESPSRSSSPPEQGMRHAAGTPRGSIPHLEKQGLPIVEGADVYVSDASAAGTVEPVSTTDTVGGGDYKEPRPLHEDYTPPLLTTFEDPIWKVVHDMREQRMSLCQSLRQYVFVHAAVIEGSLMVTDEEREIAEGIGGWRIGDREDVEQEGEEGGMRMRTTPECDDQAMIAFTLSSPLPPPSSSESGASTPSLGGIGTPLPSRSPSRSRSRSNSARRRRHHNQHHLAPPPSHSLAHPHIVSPSQPFLYSSDSVVPPSFATSYPSYGHGHAYAYGKRPSSPTELLKEDKKGEVMLSKRPSIERKRRNTAGGEGDGHSKRSNSAGGIVGKERGFSAAPL